MQPQADPTRPIQAAPAPLTPVVEDPGKTFGIVGFILTLVGLGLVGLILAIIGYVQSKKVGKNNGFALATIIINIVGAALAVLFIIILLISIGVASQQSASPVSNRAVFQVN